MRTATSEAFLCYRVFLQKIRGLLRALRYQSGKAEVRRPVLKLHLPKKRGQHGRDPKLAYWVILAAVGLLVLAFLLRSGT